MKIKKYRAADSQQAMRLIRAEQGPDASILTCYQVPEGIEFVVALDAPDIDDVDLPDVLAPRQKVDAGGDQDMQTLRQELGSMRALLEKHLQRLAVREPQNGESHASGLAERLADNGFSGELRQRLLRLRLAEHAGRDELAQALQASLADVVCGDWPSTGATALVGTPGAGKTQLLATLALQHVLQAGANPLYLISCDNQRFGAREQLLALGRVLRLPVLFATDSAALRDALMLLPGNARVLVDTAGADHGDTAALSALDSLLADAGIDRRVLVLPLDMADATQEATLSAYAGLGCAGVVLTRVDSLPRISALASWLCRHDLTWLGASIARDTALAWLPPDTGALVTRAAACWPEQTAAEIVATHELPAPVARWSWAPRRIPA